MNNIFKKDYRIVKKFKPFALAFFILTVAAIVVVSIIGFNLDYSFKGGYEFSVYIASDLKDKAVYGEQKEKITTVIENLTDKANEDAPYNFKVVRAYVNEDDTGNFIVFRVGYTGKTWDELAAVSGPDRDNTAIVYLRSAFSDSPDILFTRAELSGYSAPATFWREFVLSVILAAAFAVLGACYLILRCDFTKAFTFLISTVAGALLFFAVMAVFRLPFGKLFLAGLGAGIIFAAWNAVYLLQSIHGLENNDKFKGMPDAALIDTAFSRSLKLLFIVFAVSSVMILTTLFGWISTISLTSSLLAALVSNTFVSGLVLPGIYYQLLTVKKNRVKNKITVKNK